MGMCVAENIPANRHKSAEMAECRSGMSASFGNFDRFCQKMACKIRWHKDCKFS